MRIKPISPAQLSDRQKPLFENIQAQTQAHMHGFVTARKDGALLGPFNAMLHFPQFGEAVWGVNLALSEGSTLPKPAHELAILITGARHRALRNLRSRSCRGTDRFVARQDCDSLRRGAARCKFPIRIQLTHTVGRT